MARARKESAPPFEFDEESQAHLHAVGHLVRRAWQVGTAAFNAEVDPAVLTNTQTLVLTIIKHNPGVEATSMMELVALDSTNLGEVLKRLETKGYLKREPSPRDRRAKQLHITPAGRRVLADLSPAMERVQARVDILSKRETAELVRLLRKYCGLT